MEASRAGDGDIPARIIASICASVLAEADWEHAGWAGANAATETRFHWIVKVVLAFEQNSYSVS